MQMFKYFEEFEDVSVGMCNSRYKTEIRRQDQSKNHHLVALKDLLCMSKDESQTSLIDSTVLEKTGYRIEYRVDTEWGITEPAPGKYFKRKRCAVNADSYSRDKSA